MFYIFKNTIDGINDIFKTDIKRGKIVLVTGGPGTLKSGFVHTVLSKYLASTEEYGLYVTLEETKAELMENSQSLGVKNTNKLHISDYTDIREDMDARDENVDYIQLIEHTVELFKEDVGEAFSCLAIDSCSALYALMDDKKDIRKKMFRLFKKLKKMNLTTFMIKENVSPGSLAVDGGEEFLADGIIELGVIETHENATRYIQVKKMRTVSHSMKKFQIEASGKGLSIVGEAYSRR